MPKPLLAAVVLLACSAGGTGAAFAQMAPSTCHAVANALPKATFASFDGGGEASSLFAAVRRDEVTITYAHHSTYVIESPSGVTVATDYSGYAGPDVIPRIATMNRAHSTHYTNVPDPGIEMVLKGWGEDGGPARHAATVEDVYIRNVPTDIRGYGGSEADGNSIFVFEIAGLCIGHLGHLHHKLTDEDFAEIGRLDVVMVPVDGSWTLSQEGMGETVERLRSQIVLPMHRFAGPIERFLESLPGFAVERRDETSLTVSMKTLPDRPTVVILRGV
ncbi:MAG: MBL fold metallo-hydrolase [Rhizobiaceae bacterium]|nr:MBL fold metallo-hydrolase [Rhizobiaceae bacterium]